MVDIFTPHLLFNSTKYEIVIANNIRFDLEKHFSKVMLNFVFVSYEHIAVLAITVSVI